MKVKLLSRVQLFGTPWTVAYQAPPSMGFSRQEDWSGLPFPSPENLPNPGIEPGSPTFQVDALTSEPPGKIKEYWSGLPFLSPGDLPNPGIEPGSPALQADTLPSEPPGKSFRKKNKQTMLLAEDLVSWQGKHRAYSRCPY